MGVGWTHTKKGAEAFAKSKRKIGCRTQIKKLKEKHGQSHYAIYYYRKKR